MPGARTDAPLVTAVQLLVPLALLQLHERGGPTAEDWQWLTSGTLAQRLGTLGERLVCGATHGDPLLSEVVRSIAIMAHLPGGIHIFDQHFEVHVARERAQ